MRFGVALFAATSLVAGCSGSGGSTDSPSTAQTGAAAAAAPVAKHRERGMSPMGRLAARKVRALARAQALAQHKPVPFSLNSVDNCANEPDCPDEDSPWVDPDTSVSL